jgi:aromatic ring hydroxylase
LRHEGDAIGQLGQGLLTSVAHEIWNNVQQLGATNAAQKETPAATFIPGVGSMYGVPGKTLIALTTIRIFLPQAHAQAVDTIRMLGSSGLIMTPSEMDFRNPELNETLSQYLRGAGIAAKEKVRVMKLAWDAIGEQFGSRSFLYEQFFAGDPINNRVLYYRTQTNTNCTAMAQAFLDSIKANE